MQATGGRTMEMVKNEVTGEEVENRDEARVSVLVWIRGFFRSGLAGIGKARATRRLQLVETLQLGGKRQLMLVRCDGQLVLVGAGGDGIQSIAALRPQTQAESR